MVLRFLLLLFLFWYNHNANGSVVTDHSTNNEYSWFDYNHKLRQAVTPTDTLKFAYDALGNRNLKAKENKDSLFYVNDLQGNIMATYKLKNDSLYLVDQPLYGSSRLGTETMSRLLWQRDTNVYYSNALYGTVRGNKQYEISNHLGNVLATVSDKKVGVDTTADNVYDYYNPVEITATDYYAYGGELPERTYTNSMSEYPFGWNTQMKVNEISPTHYTAPFWEFDTRLGANGRLNRDPKPVAWESPYAVNRGNPIVYNDPNGDCATCISGMIMGVFTEILTQYATQMLVEGKEFNQVQLDGTDILVAGSTGLISGAFDGGASRFAKTIADPKVQKVLRIVTEKTVEFLISTAENIAKDKLNGKDIDMRASVLGALTEVGLGSLLPKPKSIENAMDNAAKDIVNSQEKIMRKSATKKSIEKSTQIISESKKKIERLEEISKVVSAPQTVTSKVAGNAVNDNVREESKPTDKKESKLTKKREPY